jgi:hypothetical protein
MTKTCSVCGKPIQGTEIFGRDDCPKCWLCYSENAGSDEPEPEDDVWYGLAPHHHDLTRTGSVLGSTVFDPLPEPNEKGEIVLADGTVFVPDPDAPGCGTYYRNRPAGWR